MMNKPQRKNYIISNYKDIEDKRELGVFYNSEDDESYVYNASIYKKELNNYLSIIREQSENAIKWIEALLSGKYKQCRYELGNKVKGFCCWGLGCYITNHNYHTTQKWDFTFNKKVGFIRSDGFIIPKFYNYDHLSKVNDSTKAGFKRIGKYLIKHSETNFNEEVSKAIQKHFVNKSKT